MNWYLKVIKNYATFSGRARRKEFWMFFLFHMIISIVLGAIGGALKFPMLSNIYALAVFIPYLAVAVRRVHDVGKSGWFILIPIYNLVLFCTDGEAGANQYGPNPKESGETSDHLVESTEA